MNMPTKKPRSLQSSRSAFTLIELLTVIGIMVVILAITLPAINKLTQGHSQKQAVNMISAYLASARAVAMSQHRQAGVVFYEESSARVTRPNTNQTAVAIFIESTDQTGAASGNTIFIPLPNRQTEYLPTGIKVATLDDSTVGVRLSENTSSAQQSRAIMFDANGQMILRNGLARMDLAGALDSATQIPGDWNFMQKGDVTQSHAVSSPGLIVYDARDLAAQAYPATAAGDTSRAAWLQAHADVLIVNAFTGNLIRGTGQ